MFIKNEKFGVLVRPLLLFIFIFISSFCYSNNISVIQGDNELIDQDFNLKIEKLKPFQKIKIKASSIDQENITWKSNAIFLANEQGIVSLKKNKPLKGSSYLITDPMGLFWSMNAISEKASSIFRCRNDCFQVKIDLFINEEMVESIQVNRYLKKSNIERIEIKEDNLVGTLFTPTLNENLPVIITLSGSNGGLNEERAKLLASNGFIVFALAYFGVGNLPNNLAEIPLEYFEAAFAKLKSKFGFNATKIGLYGISRGAELSLLLGSIFPNSINSIVAVAPSSVIYGSLSKSKAHAWLYQNKPVTSFANISKINISNNKGTNKLYPITTRVNYLEGMQDKSFKKATILVEKINCPILLITGGDDQMWPSDVYAKQIIKRLKGKKACYHFNYPNAGHGINIPNLPSPDPIYYHPFAKKYFSMGGSKSEDAIASQDSWGKIIDFFNKTLK